MNTIVKIVEISAASNKGLEDAVQGGLNKVAETITGLQGAWVKDINVRTTPEGQISEWRANLCVSFIVE